MRIRKRFPPPPPDPQLKNESLPSDLPNLSLPQPSDQPAPVTGIKPTTSWLLFGGNNNNIPAKLEQKDVGDEEKEDKKLWREKKEIFSNNIDYDNKKKIKFLSTPQQGSLLPQSSSSSNQDGRWCEEDHKVIPLKKRSRDHNYQNNNNNNNNNNRSNINTMKSKTNKKCPQENGNEEEQEHEEHYRGVDNVNSDDKVDDHHVMNKKNKRGSVILEGSRCSRVNGRGWRCCQQTLVGYSLCEHHLGKGRLRSMNDTVQNSMNNNRNKKKKKKEEGKKEKSLPNDYEYYGVDDDDDDDDDEDDEGDNKKSSSLMATTKKKKKMKKIGMVKARSLSSLLGQTENAIAMMIVDNDNKNEE